MKSSLDVSIDNLVGHSEAVLNALGSPGDFTPELWTNPHEFEVPYGQAITTGGEDRASDHYAAIEAFVSSQDRNAPTFVQDSYSNLDLKPIGFEVFFSTTWTVREPESAAPILPDGFVISTVETRDELSELDAATATGFGQAHGVVVYSDALLEDDRYSFYVGRSGGELVSGVLSFDDRKSVGIYSLFTLPERRRHGFGESLVRAALSDAPGLPAITNPGDMSSDLFMRVGFIEVGTRTIWVHRPE